MITENFSNVAVGSTSNDGTGDTLRNAFIKVNGNFHRIQNIGFNAANISVSNTIESGTIKTNNYQFADGSPITFGSPGVVNDETTNQRFVIPFMANTSGYFSNVFVANAKLAFNALTGVLETDALMVADYIVGGTGGIATDGPITAERGWGGSINTYSKTIGGIPMAFTAELNGVLTNGATFSHGSGASNSIGPRMPFKGNLLMATFASEKVWGNLVVDVNHNGTSNSSYRFTGNAFGANANLALGITQDFHDTPLAFNAGDTLGWKQIEAPLGANAIVITYFVRFE